MKMMIPLITCKISFGQHVSKLVFGVNVLDLDRWFQVDSVEQPIKRNSVGCRHVSHCWTSSFENHLGDSFVVFKNVQRRLALRRSCVCGDEIHMRQLLNLSLSRFSWGFSFVSFDGMVSCPAQVSFGYLTMSCSVVCRKQHFNHPVPKIESRQSIHAQSSIQRNDFRFCRSVGYRCLLLAHHWWGQMFGFRIFIRLSQTSPQGRQQSLSLEMNPVDNAVQCYPHDNIVGIRLCDECVKSILPNVCHMPESILWLLLQVCWPTTECLVFRFVPSTSMSIQFVSKLFVSSPIDSSSSCLNWRSSKQGLDTLFHCSTFLFVSSKYRSTHFWECPSMS